MDYVCYTLLFAALTLGMYWLWSRRRFYKVAWQMPGPLGLPFIGLGLDMMNPETFLQFMQKMSQSYKTPFISWMGTKCFLYVNDPETIETIFNASQCTNKGDFYRFMAEAIGDGLFTSSSPRWNKHRRLINPAFSRQVIKNFMPIFNEESDALLRKFQHACQEQDASSRYLDIYPLIKKSVLEAACQTTMGKKMNFQNDGSATIFESYNGLTEVCVKRMLSPWLYADICYRHSPLYSRERKVVQVLFDFVENLLLRDSSNNSNNNNIINNNTTKNVCDKANSSNNVEETCASVNHDNESGINNCTKSKSIFIEQVRTHIERGLLSREDVRDEANVIIAATFETTSTALYLVCLCLAMHPQYQDKLYEELLLVFPERESSSDGGTVGDDDVHAVNFEQLEQLSYTEMVINEAMRLFAPVPMVLRSATSDLTLRNGIVVPCGTQIGIDIFNMQRSTHVWGADALSFRPERQLLPPPHAFAYVPFTKGLRMCIGYRYALMLMKVMLAKIFRNYMLRTSACLEDLVIKGTISLKLREYPLCELIPRQRLPRTQNH